MKIAICIPCHGDTKALFTLSLANMLMFSKDAEYTLDGKRFSPEFKVFLIRLSNLPQARQELVRVALEWGADWLLFVDSDHTFPQDTLTRLLAHQLDMVGCNFLRREEPPRRSTAFVHQGELDVPIPTTAAKAEAKLLEEVQALGMGLCLIRAAVFGALEPPLFDVVMTTAEPIAEDIYFCNKVRRAGIKIHVDHSLSWRTGHIAEQVLRFRSEESNANAILPTPGPQQ